MAMVGDGNRVLGISAIGRVRNMTYIDRNAGGDCVLDTCDGMRNTNKQINKSKECERRATSPRNPSIKTGPAGSIFHLSELANPHAEHYNKSMKIRVFRNLILN